MEDTTEGSNPPVEKPEASKQPQISNPPDSPTKKYVKQPLIQHIIDKFSDISKVIRKLKTMQIIPEKLSLPKIIVTGDDFIGKTNVVSSLIGIRLPHGLNVPLILTFHNNPGLPLARFTLKHDEVSTAVTSENLKNKILDISSTVDSVITVVCEQQGAPELTIIDLPSHLIIASDDKEDPQYKDIKGYIMKHAILEDCVFLDVIPSSADFLSCRSTQLLKEFDATGRRTVSVITNDDLHSEDLVTKLTMNKVETCFGYVYVRCANDTETFLASEEKEKQLFEQPLFADLDESCLGRHSLARKLVLVMLFIMFKSSSVIVESIENDLKKSEQEKKLTAKKFETIDEAVPFFLSIVKSSELSLHKLFISQEYEDYKDDIKMHSAARLVEMFESFYVILKKPEEDQKTPFLSYEISVIEEWKSTSSSLVASCILNPLLEKRVSDLCPRIKQFISDVWNYIAHVVQTVLMDHARSHPQLNLAIRRSFYKMSEKHKHDFSKKINEIMELEKVYHHTCDPAFIPSYEKTKLSMCKFISVTQDGTNHDTLDIPGMGVFKVDHFKSFPGSTWQLAFDAKMRLDAYLDVVVKRFVDYLYLNLTSSLRNMIKTGMKEIMMSEFESGKDNTKMWLDEEPMLSTNRKNLDNRTEYLLKVKKDIEIWQTEFAFLLDY